MKRASLFVSIIFIVLSTQSCVFFGASSVKLYKRAEAHKPYDAIIVPGVPFDSARGKWSDIMKIRVYWSYFLYKKGIASNIIYSGSSVYTPYVESKIMAMYGEGLGIPKEKIFIEDKAEHSTENIYYSYYLGKKLGFNKIAVASDPYQSRMVRRFTKKKKLHVAFIPIIFDTLKAMDLADIPIDAEKAKVKDFVSITERESKWKRFKGTLGLNIAKKEKVLKNKNERNASTK